MKREHIEWKEICANHILIKDYYPECMVVVVYLLSHVKLFRSMDCSPQAALSTVFSRQEYWSSLPFPCLHDPGIKPMSPALQADSLLLSHQGSPIQNDQVTPKTQDQNGILFKFFFHFELNSILILSFRSYLIILDGASLVAQQQRICL